jgi:tRNA G18 (ribose-2'-O)-methylase SpoU
MIEGAGDPRIAEYRSVSEPALAAAAGVFVAEGSFVVRRLLQQDRFSPRSVLVTEAALRRLSDVLSSPPPSLDIYLTSLDVMREIAGFNIHRGCLALGDRRPPLDPLELAESARRLLVLEGLGNPDNVGGIFRNAAAFGVDAVLLGPGCADPLYRKAIRVSMAATLLVPFAAFDNWPADLAALRRHGVRLIALTPVRDAEALGAIPASCCSGDRVALLVGSEGDGLSRDAIAAADLRVRIPIAPLVDSLNAATAAGIALHWLAGRNCD